MTLSFKVPSFISDYFNGLSHDEKQEAVARYKQWYSHDFTELFLDYLEQERDKLIEEDEKKSDFSSWFQFSYKTARNKAQRLLLRDLIKKLDWRYND